jgi:hypothetical protein
MFTIVSLVLSTVLFNFMSVSKLDDSRVVGRVSRANKNEFIDT